ncbi:FecR family protein [Sandarakinorhabdus sp. DWP1-3-1]|uniref:FecR family protein n=1 Tax=Sandarakinorhabdus sp. DWP1-3-1 TaxID=2804627 RepID=UPI003CEF7442
MTQDMNNDAALDWVIRLRDPDFEGWEAFEAWLAADPANADAYQAMAVADADIARVVAAVPRPAAPARARPLASIMPPRRPVSRRWFGAAIAASVAAAAGFAVLQSRPEPYVIKTPAGMPRSIVLADGTRADLNGGTRLLFDRREPRRAELAQGEVVFTVVHDAAQPFRVVVGEATLLDVGTVFNVARSGPLTTVAVSEGAVVFNPDRDAVQLPAGRTLRAVDGAGTVTVAEAPTATMGSWRQGRLFYDGAPLSEVAADLSRNLGLVITADPAIAGRPFRGVIALGNRQAAPPPGLGPLLGVRVVQDGKTWRLAAATP